MRTYVASVCLQLVLTLCYGCQSSPLLNEPLDLVAGRQVTASLTIEEAGTYDFGILFHEIPKEKVIIEWSVRPTTGEPQFGTWISTDRDTHRGYVYAPSSVLAALAVLRPQAAIGCSIHVEVRESHLANPTEARVVCFRWRVRR